MNHSAILETHDALNERTLIADPARIADLCAYLKHDEKFVRLSAVTAVDLHPAEPRFEVIYHLHSLDKNERLRLKCRLSGGDPEIDSVYSVWRAADWYEREVFDMFGIKFRNHPNLVRILMPVDWEGYPLRKDYPVHGYKYSYPTEQTIEQSTE
ncbi:MAG TPA: NADH-quinone oxidoreductase subunit C [Bryobacteraceae bacterium]|nr:NADH-quinone oxidoreductase subunit C [Bryobacteraceae bacterium]